MTQSTTDKTYQDGVDAERLRISTLLLKDGAKLAADYRNTIKHTGGLLTQSMSYAYSKALNDAFKLVTKQEEK